jgi:hypothetical protein
MTPELPTEDEERRLRSAKQARRDFWRETFRVPAGRDGNPTDGGIDLEDVGGGDIDADELPF